ncbi:nucleotide exchange factor GrpE [Candidatus Parcubacteria bacterium]|nr:nucleotide exchange factor GrpE [Candidatus Parcubacteria bacterium]
MNNQNKLKNKNNWKKESAPKKIETEVSSSKESPKENSPANECQEYLNGWKRCLADFENYKKDELGRREKIKWQNKAEVCLEVIKVLDNFQRMNTCLPSELCENEWVKGVLMVENQLVSSLKEVGLEEIKAQGEKFNPEFHEALEVVEKTTIENEDEASDVSETILEVLEKGWLLDGKVLKPSKVKIIK